MNARKDDEDRRRTEPEDAPSPDAPEGPAGDVEGAEDELESLKSESNDLLARLQRVSADYLNYQKRVQRDIAQAREYANEELMKAILDVLDDMERALEAGRENHPADDPLLTGMELVHRKAMDTLGKFGLTTVEAEGQPFDPDKHSALMRQPTDEVAPQTVVQVVQKGYQLKGRTIRPASVIVSAAPEEDPTE